MTLEQSNRTADLVLELGVRRRQEHRLRLIHIKAFDGNCWKCVNEKHPCSTLQIIDSIPPVVTES